MLKIEGGHKVTAIGSSKNGKPFIKMFVGSGDKPQANGTNKKQGLVAQVYFKMCNMTNIDEAFNNKEFNYAELGAYRVSGIEHGIPDNKSNETTYTIQIFADYVRFYKGDKDKKQEINNDKIEVTQSNYQPQPKQTENKIDVGSDKALEEDIDGDKDLEG